MHRNMRFGVNYVPSQHWWYSWVDWDRKAIATDLVTIASLGMDHIRIHCVWPLFQPNAHYVSPLMLDRLSELLDLAHEVNLDVSIAVLDGWLSGFVFLPSWLIDVPGGQTRNIFTDPIAIDAEYRLFEAIAARVANHPRFLGFDLGNELGVLQKFGHRATAQASDAWASGLLARCEQLAPGKLHVNGVDHVQWFENAGFTRQGLATSGAATSLHTWIYFTGALERYGARGVGTLHLAEYTVELACAYHTNLARPVWVQEFGCSSEWMPEVEILAFARHSIISMATCNNIWGCTWWCSHDIDRALHGFMPFEYDLGLLDIANQPKPIAQHLAHFIRDAQDILPAPLSRATALVLPDADDAPPPDWRFASRFMDLIGDGIHPAIVLESRMHDLPYLAARGITSLII